jgi:hypothetical protein
MACDGSLRFCDAPVGCTDKKDVDIVYSNNMGAQGVITSLFVPYSLIQQSGSDSAALEQARKCGLQYKFSEIPSYPQITPKVELLTEGC